MLRSIDGNNSKPRATGNEAESPRSRIVPTGVMEGAVERLRPKMITVVAIVAGLLPIMWSSGTG